jgi:tetratricopeptide (TPR) repeat protein
MNNLAILVATSSDPKIRNPSEAVSLGEKAVELEPDNASYLDTLATAYFEAGQPGKAAETEQRALKAETRQCFLQEGSGEVPRCQPTTRNADSEGRRSIYVYDALTCMYT